MSRAHFSAETLAEYLRRLEACSSIDELDRLVRLEESALIGVPPMPLRDLQRLLGVHADGIWGPRTRAALERFVFGGLVS